MELTRTEYCSRREIVLLLAMAMVLTVFAVVKATEQSGTPQQDPQLPFIEYRIGTRDLLQITVFERPELNQTIRVSEDGSITLILLGRVEATGLTVQELEQRLAGLLKDQYLTDPHVSVFIQEYQRVAVLGAVGRPGMYELVGPTSLLQIISQAGGMTPEASNELFIYRDDMEGKKSRIAVNLRNLTGEGNQQFDVNLQPKDVVFIPVDETLTVFVYGEVRNPGALQYKASRKITLLQAIAQAGGTTEWAAKTRIMITRKDIKTGKDVKIRVNFKNIIAGRTADIILEDGDVVIVP